MPAQAGRSGKAKGQKPDMHAVEGSDCAIVPMKEPNHTEPSVAEVAEGRARTKKHDAQPDTALSRPPAAGGKNGPPEFLQVPKRQPRI